LSGRRLLLLGRPLTSCLALKEELRHLGLEVERVDATWKVPVSLKKARGEGRPFAAAVLTLAPGEEGAFDAAQVLKADPELAGLPLVLFSYLGVSGQARSAKEAGFSAYLARPLRLAQLQATLERILAPAGPREELVTRHSLKEEAGAGPAGILVVEDNAVNRKLVVTMLKKLGHKADVASHGREALAALDRGGYRLVLMDCQMPEMDGFEATRRIRAREDGQARIPIVALTANAMEGDRDRCLAAGMDGYLAKPIQTEALRSVVETWI
jgi:CheY-like chemotaxis protein